MVEPRAEYPTRLVDMPSEYKERGRRLAWGSVMRAAKQLLGETAVQNGTKDEATAGPTTNEPEVS